MDLKTKVELDTIEGNQAAKASSEAENEKSRAKIGQLLVERDFLAETSGR